MHDIAWNRRAVKALQRIASKDSERIYHDVQRLRNWPDCKNIVKLKGEKKPLSAKDREVSCALCGRYRNPDYID